MPLFEFEAGQLIPAQVGHAVSGPVEPEVLGAVRTQVLEMLRLPVFPVTWQDDDGAPRLTAMDPAGHVVSVEVLERLDARALVGALARAGRSGERGWIDVARSYPTGIGAFRRDWNAFRESQPVGAVVTARVHVVAAHIDDDARQALDALAGAGVIVHEVAVRVMSSGRLFLDVAEVSVPVAPLPWLLPGRTAASIEQHAGPAAGIAPPHAAGPAWPRPVDTGAPAEAAPVQSEVAPVQPVAVDEQPSGRRAASGTAAAQPVAPDEELLGICASLDGPATLVWTADGRRQEATLLPDGWIVVGGTPFGRPEDAAAAVAGEHPGDAWSVWRFGEDGPSLHEAREELRGLRTRRRRAATSGPRLSRRELRRRATSE